MHQVAKRPRHTTLKRLSEVRDELDYLESVVSSINFSLEPRILNRIRFFRELDSKVLNVAPDANLPHAIGHGIRVTQEVEDSLEEEFSGVLDEFKKWFAEREFMDPELYRTHLAEALRMIAGYEQVLSNDDNDFDEIAPVYSEFQNFSSTLRDLKGGMTSSTNFVDNDSSYEAWITKLKNEITLPRVLIRT